MPRNNVSPDVAISRDSVLEHLSKILASGPFAESPRMSRFLRFAVEESLNGRAERLKEIVIGGEVFDRAPDYDPRLDPIVRVEARRLRSKLGEYYEGPGRHDAIVLELPKGGYATLIRRNESAPPAAPEPDSHARRTIAILPFSNLSADPDGQYLSDGVTEELIQALTRVPGLRVVAWNTAAMMRDRQEDMESIRRMLNVAHALRGSVRLSGARLRVAAHLIDTATGEYLWSQTYDRQLNDVFSIQAEIASSIASALRLQFAAPGVAEPRDLECYQLCLKGRFQIRERTIDSLRRGLACFERALALDETFALAHAGLADTLTLFADYGVARANDCIPRARNAARRALELDPFSAEAHASLGLMLALFDWKWEESAAEFRRAIELNPGYANAHHWFAVDNLCMVGHFEEAVAHVNTAVEMDPLSPIILEGRAFLRTLMRRYDEAIEGFQKVIDAHPSFYKGYTSLGRALILKGQYPEAIASLQQAIPLAGRTPSTLGALGEAYARSGDTAAARAILAELTAMSSVRPVYATSFAVVHIGLGEHDEALTLLEHAVKDHELQMASLKVHPVYDDLRNTRRFRALIRKIGF